MKPKKIKPEKKIKNQERDKLAGQPKIHQIDDNSIFLSLVCTQQYQRSILTSDLSVSLFSKIIEQDGPILVK